MKRVIIFLAILVMLTTLVSADVIFTDQPKEIYNYGDILEIPIKITTTENIQSTFRLNIICNGIETNVNSQDIQLSSGEEKSIKPLIILNKEKVERAGTCLLKPYLGIQAYNPSQEFTLSEFISVELSEHLTETTPEKQILVEGSAKKDNGNLVNGFVELKVIKNNETILTRTNTVKQGYFILDFTFPKETTATQYLISVNVYETDSENIQTNKGYSNYNLRVNQVPTFLELVFKGL